MATEIIIVDDDPIGGGLTNTLLREAGFTTQLIHDSLVVLDAVKAERPRLVLLDILMPGVDGLTLCHQIKSDPALGRVKVAMVSGKSFEPEKERARRYGAEAFIEKPYSVDTFAQRVIELIGQPAAGPAGQAGAQPISVRVWGGRGEGAAAGSAFGAATCCVSVETSTQLFILDAGSGMDALGAELARSAKRHEAWILLTHFHPAHVAGLGRFAPLRKTGWKLHIAGPSDPDLPLKEGVHKALESSFATHPDAIAAQIQLYEVQEGHYDLLPGVRLSPFYGNHPGTTLGFSLETEGKRIIYCPDSEVYGEAASAMQDFDEKLANLCRGADLLIQDARWTDEDYQTRKNQGHSSWVSAVGLASRAQVGRLVLFHQDGSYADGLLTDIEAKAREALKQAGVATECDAAREGLKLQL